MKIVLSRVDERLIHGQIIAEWITRVEPTHLTIIDEELVRDPFMANIYKALTPLWLDVQTYSPAEACSFLRDNEKEDWRMFLLARSPQSFEQLIRSGYHISEIVLADKKYLPNKRNLPAECKRSVNWLLEQGTCVTVQEFHADKPCVLTPYPV